MKFQKGDIVASAPGYAKAVFVITELNPNNPKNCYVGKNIVTDKAFRLSDEGLGLKIGTATPEYLGGNTKAEMQVPADFEMGQRHAEVKAKFDKVNGHIWAYLAKLKHGAPVMIRGPRNRVETFKYHRVMMQGVKYAFEGVSPDGRIFRLLLASVIITDQKNTPNIPKRRSMEELIDAFRNVESQLSPENLTCDGELPAAQVRERQRKLELERSTLIQELGYEPSFEQLYHRNGN